jgi:hypothetical protein
LFTILAITVIYLVKKVTLLLVIAFGALVIFMLGFIISSIFKYKRLKNSFIGTLILLLLLLPITKPSEDTFYNWLSITHDTSCMNDICTFDSAALQIVEQEKDDYFLVNKIGIKLQDENPSYNTYLYGNSYFLIEGIGIFGWFITFTYKPVYE